MRLDELRDIKRWQVSHRDSHPVEYHLWDLMLTGWMVGWIGWMPAFLLQAEWALPACVLAVFLPDLYAAWRLRAHRQASLRCDWARLIPASLAGRPDVRR